jgi:uncharacterized phage protein gp47/JayE
MSNAITQTGFQKDTAAQTLDKFLNGTSQYPGMLTIYGAGINVNPNSPDGQFINIGVQFTQDMLEFINQVYSSFDPDQAIGTSLDQRCAINGVVRNAGTYTYTDVLVTVTQAVTLAGLNTSPTAPFTVSDASGNLFFLVATKVFSAAGSATLSFRAAVLGAVLTVPNTITIISTVTLGVSTINNPAAATTTGTAEETDYDLRIRRARSVALASKGYFQGLYDALSNVTGVTDVLVLENITNTTDANGIPAHSIWCVVAGTASATDVANAIYLKRNAGCGMKGAISTNVTQADNSLFAVLYDVPVAQNIWIRCTGTAVTGSLDAAYLKTSLLAGLSYGIGEKATASNIVARLQALAPNGSFSVEGVSLDGTTWTSLVATTGVNYQFVPASARTTITVV